MSSILLVFVCIMSSPVFAKSWYFSKSGSNGYPCTVTQPCVNQANFVTQFAPGDSILFKRGDVFPYMLLHSTEVGARSGTQTSPIYYGAYGSGAKPAFDGGGGTGYWGIRVVRSSWIVMEDLESRRWAGFGLEVAGSTNINFRRIAISQIQGPGVHAVERGDTPSQFILFEDFDISYVGLGDCCGEFFYLGVHSSKPEAPDRTSDVTIRRAYLHNHGATMTNSEAIEGKGCVERITIEDSVIENPNVQGIFFDACPHAPFAGGDHRIRNNRIIGSGKMTSTSTRGRGIHLNGVKALVHNNLIYNGTSYGIEIWDTLAQGFPVNIYNNTIYKNRLDAVVITAPNVSVKNNLSWLNGSGNFSSDPKFVNAAAGDFRLLDTSPAIDRGVNVGLPYLGGAPDLGACEFGVNGPCPSSTSTPSPTPAADTTAPTVPAGLSALAVSASEIKLSWSASTDNVGVAGYRVYRNGAQIASVTGTSYSNTGLTDATTYSYSVLAFDAAGNLSGQSASASSTTLSSISSVWSNSAFTSQSGQFQVDFDLVPLASGIEVLIGLSNGLAGDYPDLAAIVRLNKAGQIDARNGAAYAALVAVPYTAGQSLHVRMRVDVSNHRYDVYVTAPGASELLLAKDYAFRTEQALVSSLDNRATYGGTGTFTLNNFIALSLTEPVPLPAADTIAPTVSITSPVNGAAVLR